MSLFIPTYFSPISQYAEIVKSDEIIFEMEDNFQKQSYRNRCYIYNGNGKQLLSIPVKQSKKEGRKKTKDTLVENDFPWQDQHFKSLQTSYRVSPYFEYFEDDLMPIFTKKYKFLHDVNIDTYLFIVDALELNPNFSKTTVYELEKTENDFRFLADKNHENNLQFNQYKQMFDDKHGFIPNLSILDLLFMEGPNAVSYF
ncbi:WbqC family protein [Polaribacter sp.]|uniref:WbqC family protein n=1 Tax=Polaribacter sp. TaxID=1920175 RepID=UPI004047944D